MLDKINISTDRQKLIVYVVLTVVTFAIFWQVNRYDFVFDDVYYITENSHIQSGITLDGLRWTFSTTYYDGWHPIIWLSFMLDYQLFGLNGGGYHLTNLFLHILSTLLLFWLFNRMTGGIWKSAFVAALFAFHPLHVESVAWIAERKDVLSAFFWMLTLCFYVYYTEKPSISRYVLVLFGFILALISKPMVITLPVIMILLDYWPLERFQFKRNNIFLWQLREKTPFFIFSAVFSILTIYDHSKLPMKEWILPWSSRIFNAPVSFMTYLEKTFWPHDMAAFYPFPAQISVWLFIGTSLIILVITTIVIVMAKRFHYLLVGWLWYAITILPVIGIIQISNYSMADRYHYLSSIGIAIMLAWGIPLLFPHENTQKKILFPAAITTLIIFAALTWNQCSYWRNSIELWNHALKVTKNNYLAHNNVADALLKEGENEKAIYHYNKAINIKPDFDLLYFNRGVAYDNRGQYRMAIDDYNEAIHLTPDHSMVYYSRGVAYDNLGQYQMAINDYNEAIRLKPDFAMAYNNRGWDYLMQYNKERGCVDVQKACKSGICKASDLAKVKGFCR